MLTFSGPRPDRGIRSRSNASLIALNDPRVLAHGLAEVPGGLAFEVCIEIVGTEHGSMCAYSVSVPGYVLINTFPPALSVQQERKGDHGGRAGYCVKKHEHIVFWPL